VLSPPDELTPDLLESVLAAGWRITAASPTYRPVGWGSHHWEVSAADGARWFLTADDLAARRRSLTEPYDAAFDRLRAALAATMRLRAHGRAFVVAPLPTTGAGDPLVRVLDRFAVALYPYQDGQSFDWGDFPTVAHRYVVLDLLTDVHSAPAAVRREALADDFAIPHLDALAASLDPDSGVPDCGPYAARAAALLADHADPIGRVLARYDELADVGRSEPDRMVLTHGEPHRANTMLTADGWRLIDWETALLAPPERDLWHVDPGDGSVLGLYAAATGVTPLESMMELYRIRWLLADLAIEADRFRRPHSGTEDDDQAWRVLGGQVTEVADRARLSGR
jgi:spectinomycin phosphotransferase/16S rRNA (guanine(1405)-N(7))-methyltransferase